MIVETPPPPLSDARRFVLGHLMIPGTDVFPVVRVDGVGGSFDPSGVLAPPPHEIHLRFKGKKSFF